MRRGAFTLLEAVLATVIASLVMAAAWSLLASLERSEQSVRRRAHQLEQLQRTRLVMERAFGSILVSQPAPARRPATAVATPVDESGGEQAGSGGAASGPARRFSTRDSGSEAGSRASDAPSRSTSVSRGTGAGTQIPSSQSPSAARAPDDVPPRIILHTDDWLASTPMTVRSARGVETVVTPQRLEMVLIEPPVPTQQPDPFVLAKAVKLEARRRGLSRRVVDEPSEAEADVVPEGTGADIQEQDWGIRAVRGAFELVPKPGRDGRMLVDEFGHPKAWELWWVPQSPRRSLSEVREMGRARAMLEASSFGEPYLIATDLASVQWRMYDDRQRKLEFEATIQNQLPAYVEVDVSTTGGISASWLFEVSWATGVEVKPAREDASANAGKGASGPTDASSAPSSSRDSGKESSGGSKGAAK